jgi:hypothetical protein
MVSMDAISMRLRRTFASAARSRVRQRRERPSSSGWSSRARPCMLLSCVGVEGWPRQRLTGAHSRVPSVTPSRGEPASAPSG